MVEAASFNGEQIVQTYDNDDVENPCTVEYWEGIIYKAARDPVWKCTDPTDSTKGSLTNKV